MLAVAVLAMTATLLAHHLGFFDAVISVLSQVGECYKCCTFWVVLWVLLYLYREVLTATVIAFCAAYSSHWIMLLFGELNIIYNKIWQSQEKRRRKTNSESNDK